MHHEIQQETLSKPKTRQLKSVLCSEEALIKATDWSSNQMTCLNTTLWVLNDVWLHTPPSYWPAVGPHHVIPSALVIDRAALPFLLLQPRTGRSRSAFGLPSQNNAWIAFILLFPLCCWSPIPRRSPVEYEKVRSTETVSYWSCGAGGKLWSCLRWTSQNWIWRFTLAGPRWACRVKTKGQVPQLVSFSSPAHLIAMEYVSLRSLGCWVNLHLSSGDGERRSKGENTQIPHQGRAETFGGEGAQS